jgi:glycerophosphoryl diester phosphodiesterase
VATNKPASHRFFADHLPDILLFYSVGDRQDLTSLQEDPDLVALIDGVSIQHELVDEETARWMNEHGIRMLVWTVNDLGRANELIRLGVGAITTDNLALMGLFGGQRRGEETWDPREATPQPTNVQGTPQASTGRGA